MTKLKGLKDEISEAQKVAMLVIQEWVREKRTPMPKKELFKKLINMDMADSTIRMVIRELLKDGYIRRAVVISNKTFYVQLRTI
jgi:hypothetical protein